MPVPPPTLLPPVSIDPCRIGTGAQRPGTFVVALTENVDARTAPVPSNDAERLVFRHLYATIARRDCAGMVHPGLASQVFSDSTGRVWVAELAAGTFSDGSQITADAVIDQWRSVAPSLPFGITSLRALRSRTLEVTLAEPADSIPAIFTDAAYAVGGARTPTGWSAASAHFEIDPGSTGGSGSLRLRSRAAAAPLRLELRVTPGADPRDLLDQGADLVVTRDPLAIAYARADSAFRAVPLPWDRVYALISAAGDTSAATRAALAAAVRAESRAAGAMHWWTQGESCRAAASRRSPRSARIVYPRADPTARDLAERIVSLARRSPALAAALGGSSSYVAVPLTSDALRVALVQGNEAGYVVALPQLAPAACVAMPPLPAGAAATPLIETRAHALLRRSTAGVLIDGDGGVRVDDAGLP